MGFDASVAVPALEWDFRAYGAGEGTSPEPSDVMIERFRRKYLRMMTAIKEQVQLTAAQLEQDDSEVSIPRLLSIAESVKAMNEITGDDEVAATINRQMCQITSEVLSGQPSPDQIQALPLRVRAAFFGWVIGQVLNPESYAAVTRPSLRAVAGG